MDRTRKDIENCKRERPSHILRQAYQKYRLSFQWRPWKSQEFKLISCKFSKIIDANQDYYSKKNYQAHVKKKEKNFHDKNI